MSVNARRYCLSLLIACEFVVWSTGACPNEKALTLSGQGFDAASRPVDQAAVSCGIGMPIFADANCRSPLPMDWALKPAPIRSLMYSLL